MYSTTFTPTRYAKMNCNVLTVSSSVANPNPIPDPHVFGSPGFVSINQR